MEVIECISAYFKYITIFYLQEDGTSMIAASFM